MIEYGQNLTSIKIFYYNNCALYVSFLCFDLHQLKINIIKSSNELYN